MLPEPDLRGKRVLVVDDNQTSREILQDMLESMSFKVSQAPSGEEALSEISRLDKEGELFEVVFMDWQMPGMNGIATSRKIKEQDLTTQPKIIMVTAYGREDIIQQSADAGLEGFLVKPVSRSLLFDTIMQALGREGIRSSPLRIEKDKGIEALKDIRGARILLAEDNEINQQVAREILEQAALVVEIANNGLEAVEMAQKNPYDVILMDIQMPEMNGFEATRRIRELELEAQSSKVKGIDADKVSASGFELSSRSGNIPIVAMTAHAIAGDREKSINAGMKHHVTKPIDPDQLFSALMKWIEPGEREVPEAFEAKAKEKSEDEILPAKLPGLSIKSGVKKVGGNKKLYGKLLRQFLENNKDATNEIKRSLNQGDTETAARLAHTVKGVSGNLGAEELFPVAGELEKAIKQEEIDAIDSLLKNFETHLNVVLGGIEVLKEQEAARKKQALPAEEIPIDIGLVTPILTEMAELLESDLVEAMSRLELLKLHLENSSMGGEFRRLEKSLESFDTDDAVRSLQRIAEGLNIPLKENG